MEEEIQTIEEDVIFAGVSSVNGETGDVSLKTINGEEITGEGNIEIEATGTVKSVNNIEPDEEGNVTLTASDVNAQEPLTAGTNITIEDNVISASGEPYTAGTNITIDDGVISATDTTYTAGTNVSISNENVISATDTTYSAGNGLTLSGTEFSANTTVLATQNDLSGKQNTLTAGDNITISNDTISATDTTYTAGTGIDITSGSISVDTSTIQPKLTAGSNISISGNEISATDTTYSAFTGTDGTAAGTAGLVPAPATTDAGKYLKADGTWSEAGGGITTLTTADYNHPTNNPVAVALWKLPAGVYKLSANTQFYPSSMGACSVPADTLCMIFKAPGDGNATIEIWNDDNGHLSAMSVNDTGTANTYYTPSSSFPWTIITAKFVKDELTSTSAYMPLSAKQGKVLKGLIDSSCIGTTETLTIATADWTALASSDPYDYSATVTLTATIGASSTVELINDQAVLFGTHGFAIGSVSGQNVTIYSIGQPSASVTLKINVKG